MTSLTNCPRKSIRKQLNSRVGPDILILDILELHPSGTRTYSQQPK